MRWAVSLGGDYVRGPYLDAGFWGNEVGVSVGFWDVLGVSVQPWRRAEDVLWSHEVGVVTVRVGARSRRFGLMLGRLS